MVKRLAVCRAILHDPELLILDEPLANLDPAGAEVVAPLLGPGRGRTRILVTHDVGAALEDADRVLGLERDGSVAFELAGRRGRRRAGPRDLLGANGGEGMSAPGRRPLDPAA